MPDLPEPDLNRVREAMRAHDRDHAAPASDSGAADELHDGVTEARLDFEGSERFQPLRRELGVTTFGLNLMRMQPGQRSRIHRHERQEEVYVVLEGTLTLAVEGEERTLGQGEAIRVAPDVRRQLVNRGDERLVMLALGGTEPFGGRDGVAYRAWEDEEGAPPQEVPFPDDLA